jgi:hypothetical protein
MNPKITKRDVKFFLLGVLTLLLVDLVWDWDRNVKAFKEGWKSAEIQNTK